MLSRKVLAVFALALVGCPASDGQEGGTEVGSTSTTTTGSSGGSVGPGSSSTNDSTSSTSGGEDSTSSSTGVSCDDVAPVDNPETYNCSVWDQDCPACHKCTHAWNGNDPGVPPGFGSVCVPVHPDPVDTLQPCTYGDEVGVDNCSANAFCWSPDPATSDGYCIEFCEQGKTCGEGFTCIAGGDGALGCVPTCDPFAPDCPDPVEQCMFYNGEASCSAAPSDLPAAPGLECFGICGEGFGCVNADAYGPDCAFDRCCTPLCDAGHPCADAEQSCYGTCGEASEDISVCVVPGIEPPGQCPPDDAEPNYPWCSGGANDDCRQSFGGGNDCVELCFCEDPCDAPADCPVPETGTATVECTDTFADQASCMLSCANGETCPNGMYCADELFPGYCMWYVEEEPGCLE